MYAGSVTGVVASAPWTAVALAFCVLPAHTQGTQGTLPHTSYAIERLGTLGGLSGNGLGLNARGDVAGGADNALEVRHACAWRVFSGPALDLDAGAPTQSSEAWGINGAMDVAGYHEVAGTFRAVLWSMGEEPLELLPGVTGESFAYDVNGAREVVGVEPGGGYFWSAAVGARSLGRSMNAWALNADGDVAGSALQVSPQAEVAAVWEHDRAAGEHSGPIPLVPGSTYGVAFDVNDAGSAVGWANGPSSPTPFAFLSAKMGATRELTFLGGLRGSSYSIARGVNAANQVVGTSGGGVGLPRAFLWDPEGGMVDLNELVPASRQDKWDLVQANAINDDGVIVGYGVHYPSGGAYQAFRMTPSSPNAGPRITATRTSNRGASVAFAAGLTGAVVGASSQPAAGYGGPADERAGD